MSNTPGIRIGSIEMHRICPAFFNPAENSSQVWNRDVTFMRGKRYLVKSPSGTGKSTLCRILYGNCNVPYTGSLMFDGTPAFTGSLDSISRLRRENIACLPQEMMLFGELSVMENIQLKNRLTNCKSAAEIDNMLELLGMADFRNRPTGTLSLGQQQRVAVVRALCQPFDFILADEPVSHLDLENNRKVASLICSEADKQGAGIIATSVGSDLMLENPFETICL